MLLNYSTAFYAREPLPRGVSISDNVTASRKTAFRIIASSLAILSLSPSSSFLSSFPVLPAAIGSTRHACKRISRRKFTDFRSPFGGASRNVDTSERRFRQFPELLSASRPRMIEATRDKPAQPPRLAAASNSDTSKRIAGTTCHACLVRDSISWISDRRDDDKGAMICCRESLIRNHRAVGSTNQLHSRQLSHQAQIRSDNNRMRN